MHTGIDVSENNGHVDWAQVAQAGFTFAFARATLGRDSNDPTFDANRDAARAHGLRLGAYHLPYPSHSSAEQQAQHFLSVANPRPGDLLPAIDVEEKTPTDTGEAKLSRNQLVAWLRAWLNAVERSIGHKPVVYTNPNWWRSRLQDADLSEYPLWLAHYTEGSPSIPHRWKTYTIWQYSERGHVGGHVFDLNRCPNLDALTIGAAGPHSLLVLGARRPEVVRLKQLLRAWCKAHPPRAQLLDNDVFGKKTLALVKRFQKARGLVEDGKVGGKTWTALEHTQVTARPRT